MMHIGLAGMQARCAAGPFAVFGAKESGGVHSKTFSSAEEKVFLRTLEKP